ncbi:MAG: GNAT family N-acetyltransferase [Gemmatimonadaceae bacterium]
MAETLTRNRFREMQTYIETKPLNEQPTLTTERLILRPFVDHDAFDVERLAGMREIADTTLNIPHPYPHGGAAEWIRIQAPAWTDGTSATFAIVGKKTGALVGAMSLMIKREHRRAELGYWIALDCWNRGYATEAAERTIDFGFETLGLHRIEARHFVRNPASGRVMLKLGMQQEGVERDWAIKWNRFETLAVYSILEPEWRAARARA